MRAWRTPGGFLADRGPTSLPVISSQVADLPEGPWRELHEFAALDSAGAVLERFRVTVWSVDDDLGISTHAVIDGELRNLTVVVSTSGRVRREERAVVSGLEELSDLPFVRAALDRRDRLPEALGDDRLGDAFRRAQAALTNRVPSLGREPAFAAALDAYVTACRLAAFDPAPPPKPFSGSAIDVPELREPLAALERELREKADQQEWSDARLNAIEYRKAADLVARARALLSVPIP
jgi:hypothetical protein